MVDPCTVCGAGGVILDRHGRPVLGPDGKPLIVRIINDPLHLGGSAGDDGAIRGVDGNNKTHRSYKGLSRYSSRSDPRIPPGGSVGPDGQILDINGSPVLDRNGQPMFISYNTSIVSPHMTQATPPVPPGGSIGAGGVILDASGEPVLGVDGMPLVVTDPRVPAGGSIGAGGVILDSSGKPVLGADGRPLITTGAMDGGDPRMPPGGSIGAGGVILDASGVPVLGADGMPQFVTDARVPAGGTIGAGGVILDASGKPVLGADGMPLIAGGGGGDNDGADPRIPPGGSIGDGGIILDKNGKPALGSDGNPQFIADPRVPPGGSIRPPGVIYDANGNPVLGPDGNPLTAGRGRGRRCGGARSPSPRLEYIPMGRMVTLRNMRAANIPASSGKKRDPDPYLLCALLDETGNEVDEHNHKTGHLRNVSSCDWMGELHAVRVFTKPDPRGDSNRPKPQIPLKISLRISLMDWSRKSEDRLIAKWDVSVKGAKGNRIAKGRRTLDIPASSGSPPRSSERAYIAFEYEVTPQMVLPQVEEGEDSEVDEDGFDDDDTDDGASANVGVD